VPGDHPAYLHALADLRDARWNLEHRPGDAAVGAQSNTAITEIDRAIGEIKKAAREDEKNLHNHPRDDANLERPGRLHRAVESLEKAHGDLAKEEANPETRELKRRALDHVDRAIEAAKHAVHDVERNQATLPR
jgi:Sec-independent protein translocase protein TatA